MNEWTPFNNNEIRIGKIEKLVNEMSEFSEFGFLAQVLLAELLSMKLRNQSYLVRIGLLLKSVQENSLSDS